MSRTPTDLVGIFEIAQRAGVTPQAVTNWVSRRADFPPPLAVLASGKVWDGAEVMAWLRQSGMIADLTGGSAMKTFSKGQCYPMAEIQAAFGGDNMSYLPRVGNRIVCGRFTSTMNPHAPYEILVGEPPRVQQAAELMAEQRGRLPVFLKERPNAWRYCGELEFVDYVTDGRVVGPKTRAAGRQDVVVGMLLFREPTGASAGKV